MSTLLIDRDKYLGDELVDNKLETMHKAFRLCRRNVIKQSNQNKKLQHVKANPEVINLNDPVYLYNHARNNKMEEPWLPNYRVIKKIGDHTFIIKHQLTGATKRAHQRDLRVAPSTDNWQAGPFNNLQRPNYRPRRATRLAFNDSESDVDTSDSENTVVYYKSSSDSDLPLQRLRGKLKVKHSQVKGHRDSSDDAVLDQESLADEDDIPLDRRRRNNKNKLKVTALNALSHLIKLL